MWPFIVAGSVVPLWALLNMKTSRSDGTLIKKVHAYRTMLGYIMPTRNESVVYFDTYVNAEQLVEYIPRARERFHCDVTHTLVAACNFGLIDAPQMNTFISGRRLYRRKGAQVTFSMKRQKLNRKAKLSAVKREVDGTLTFRELCERINSHIHVERSDKKTHADKELGFFSSWPRPLLRAGIGAVRLLDYYNILPHSFIKNDGMYTSCFIANLGSVGMDPGYHHLYEWGNCPLFMMVGRLHDRPVVKDGQVVPQKTLHVRWSYDERIDDGLSARFGIDSVKKVLENPFEYLGCLAEDGSDAKPINEWPTAHPLRDTEREGEAADLWRKSA